jgi:nitrate reductase delta subunit
LRKPDLAAVAKAWADGPPAEDVGLEPFAPPEYLGGIVPRGEHGLEVSP